MAWIYKNKEYDPKDLDPKVIYGFVYEITNLDNNRKYIGKKFFWATKTYQKSLKRKKRKVESDWRDYYGSSDMLLEDLVDIGKERFDRRILKLCKTKSECAYFEAKYQFKNKVLESEEYYNSWIMVKVRKAHLTKL
jgi:hypothetical protein